VTPAQLDALLAAQRKDGEHGHRNCPKCGLGYMRYVGPMYACAKCAWVEMGHAPWPSRALKQSD
jgi:uncharacterized protein (DUF983 family)